MYLYLQQVLHYPLELFSLFHCCFPLIFNTLMLIEEEKRTEEGRRGDLRPSDFVLFFEDVDIYLNGLD